MRSTNEAGPSGKTRKAPLTLQACRQLVPTQAEAGAKVKKGRGNVFKDPFGLKLRKAKMTARIKEAKARAAATRRKQPLTRRVGAGSKRARRHKLGNSQSAPPGSAPVPHWLSLSIRLVAARAASEPQVAGSPRAAQVPAAAARVRRGRRGCSPQRCSPCRNRGRMALRRSALAPRRLVTRRRRLSAVAGSPRAAQMLAAATRKTRNSLRRGRSRCAARRS